MKFAAVTFVGLAGPASSTDSGAVRSTTQLADDVPPRFPDTPFDGPVTVWDPSASGPGTGHGLVQVTARAPSRAQPCETGGRRRSSGTRC